MFLISAWATGGIAAEQSTGLPHIGVVAPNVSAQSEDAQALRDGLRAAGYDEGRSIVIDWWYGNGSYNHLDDAIASLVARKVDVMVVESTVAALATKRATSTIPIVMAAVADPVGSGIVASLAQPGGNITGLSMMTTDLSAKRLGLLKGSDAPSNTGGSTMEPAHTLAPPRARGNQARGTVVVDRVDVTRRAERGRDHCSHIGCEPRRTRRLCTSLRTAFSRAHQTALLKAAANRRLPVITAQTPVHRVRRLALVWSRGG